MILFDSDKEFVNDISADPHGWRSNLSYKQDNQYLVASPDDYEIPGAHAKYTDFSRLPGTKGVEFEVNRMQGDRNNYRSELRGINDGVNRGLIHHTPYWAAFSLWIPFDWVADYRMCVLFQTHSSPAAPKNTSPGVGLHLSRKYLHYRNKYSSNGVTPMAGVSLPIGSPLVPGNWYDIALRMVLSARPNEDAQTDIYIDGRLVHESREPNASLQASGEEDPAYLDLGCYKSPWSDPGVSSWADKESFVFSSIRIGDGLETLESMSPSQPK